MLRQFLLMLLVFSLGMQAANTAHAAKKVAFLVGVNKYKKPGFRNLSYAERDVSEMSKQLKAFGFDVTLILGNQATKSNLDTTINKLVAPLSKEDMILVMLTGHGVQRAGGDAFYCPYDAIAENDASLFSLTKLLKTTLAPNVGTKLLLIDACRNDPDPGRGRSGGIQGKVIALPEDTAVMFSCRSGQQSFENDEIKHGVFTYCVLEALRGGALNDGEISWSDLQSRVKRKMSSLDTTKYIPKGRRQTPIPAGGVPYTVLARVEMIKPTIVAKPSLLVVPFSKKQGEAKQTEWAKYLKKEATITNSIGMKFNLIPPGEFKMGRTKSSDELAKLFETKAEYFDPETPHKVRITKPYYMGTTEVTQKQWKSVMGTEPWKKEKYQMKTTREGDDFPAMDVFWDDAQKFVEKLSQKENANYRLPTEAEWEYACRAGSESMFCFGGSLETLESYAWFRKNAYGKNERYAHPVGLKMPNNFGLFDIHGNLFELCSGWYAKDYHKNSPLIDPSGAGPESGIRILRGACWRSDPMVLRSADRTAITRVYFDWATVGFRVSRTP